MADMIYIRGFPKNFTAKDLKAKFSEFGKVQRSYIEKVISLILYVMDM